MSKAKSFIDIYLSIIRDAISRLSGGGSGPSVDIVPLAVSSNGTYTAEEGEAYSPVNVNVRPDVVSKYIYANGSYRASSENHDGFSIVDIDVRGDFLPSAVSAYIEHKNEVQSAYIKDLLATQTGGTVTIRTPVSVTVNVNEKVLFDGEDATAHLIYGAWGTVTATRLYSTYRSVTIRIDGVSARPTGAVPLARTGYGTYNVLGDMTLQVNPYLENVSSYVVSQNGQYTITAQPGYDGLSSVTVDVNVGGGGGEPTLTELYAYGDDVYTPASGEAYSILHIDTGMSAPYGEVVPVALSMPVNGTFTPSQYVAFSEVWSDVHPASEGTTVVDVTIYGDGTYVAAAGFAFGTVTVATSSAGPSQAVTVNSYSISSNGYFQPQSGEAFGEVTIDVNASADNLPAFLEGNNVIAEYPDVLSVRQYACYYAENASLSFPKATVAGKSAFRHATNCSIYAPALEQIGDTAFAECSGTAVLNLDSLVSAGTGAFQAMPDLEELTLLSLPVASSKMCYSCTALRKIEFGDSITSMESQALYNTSGLETLIIRNTSAVVTIRSDSLSSMSTSAKIYVPDSLVSSYQSAQYWSTRAGQIYPLSQYVG